MTSTLFHEPIPLGYTGATNAVKANSMDLVKRSVRAQLLKSQFQMRSINAISPSMEPTKLEGD